jgi:hypothetical protein
MIVSIWVVRMPMSWWGLCTVAGAVGRWRGATGVFGGHVECDQVIAVWKTTSIEQLDIVGQESDSMLALLRYVFCRSDAALIYPTVSQMSINVQGRHVFDRLQHA